jgi:hypothetical protein
MARNAASLVDDSACYPEHTPAKADQRDPGPRMLILDETRQSPAGGSTRRSPLSWRAGSGSTPLAPRNRERVWGRDRCGRPPDAVRGDSHSRRASADTSGLLAALDSAQRRQSESGVTLEPRSGRNGRTRAQNRSRWVRRSRLSSVGDSAVLSGSDDARPPCRAAAEAVTPPMQETCGKWCRRRVARFPVIRRRESYGAETGVAGRRGSERKRPRNREKRHGAGWPGLSRAGRSVQYA